MKYAEQARPQRQKVEQWLSKAEEVGRKWGVTTIEYDVFHDDEMVLSEFLVLSGIKLIAVMVTQLCAYVKTFEIHTFDGYTVYGMWTISQKSSF